VKPSALRDLRYGALVHSFPVANSATVDVVEACNAPLRIEGFYTNQVILLRRNLCVLSEQIGDMLVVEVVACHGAGGMYPKVGEVLKVGVRCLLLRRLSKGSSCRKLKSARGARFRIGATAGNGSASVRRFSPTADTRIQNKHPSTLHITHSNPEYTRWPRENPRHLRPRPLSNSCSGQNLSNYSPLQRRCPQRTSLHRRKSEVQPLRTIASRMEIHTLQRWLLI
jgi:ribosomal protein L35